MKVRKQKKQLFKRLLNKRITLKAEATLFSMRAKYTNLKMTMNNGAAQLAFINNANEAVAAYREIFSRTKLMVVAITTHKGFYNLKNLQRKYC